MPSFSGAVPERDGPVARTRPPQWRSLVTEGRNEPARGNSFIKTVSRASFRDMQTVHVMWLNDASMAGCAKPVRGAG